MDCHGCPTTLFPGCRRRTARPERPERLTPDVLAFPGPDQHARPRSTQSQARPEPARHAPTTIIISVAMAQLAARYAARSERGYGSHVASHVTAHQHRLHQRQIDCVENRCRVRADAVRAPPRRGRSTLAARGTSGTASTSVRHQHGFAQEGLAMPSPSSTVVLTNQVGDAASGRRVDESVAGQ